MAFMLYQNCYISDLVRIVLIVTKCTYCTIKKWANGIAVRAHAYCAEDHGSGPT